MRKSLRQVITTNCHDWQEHVTAMPSGALPRIDRDSPVPLYFQLAQHLELAIDAGHIPAGSRLDNEIQFAAQLGLSRPTVRRAIQYLVDKGLVVRKRGVGTTVVRAKVKRGIELTSLYDDLAKAGQEPSTRVLSNAVAPAGAEVAQALDQPEGAPVTALERVRFAHGEPIALMRNYLPGTVPAITTPALEQHGLYELIRSIGIYLHSAIQTIGARTANAAEARILGETKRATLLTMERTAYDERGHAVEYGSHVYRASRYYFEQTLRAR
jgi:DNA-binding GntR family transcriptional regulator